MLCGLTRPAIEAGLVGEIDQQARRERANREAANEAGEETEEEGVEEVPPVDIDGDIYRDGDGEASYLSSSRLTGYRELSGALRVLLAQLKLELQQLFARTLLAHYNLATQVEPNQMEDRLAKINADRV